MTNGKYEIDVDLDAEDPSSHMDMEETSNGFKNMYGSNISRFTVEYQVCRIQEERSWFQFCWY